MSEHPRGSTPPVCRVSSEGAPLKGVFVNGGKLIEIPLPDLQVQGVGDRDGLNVQLRDWGIH